MMNIQGINLEVTTALREHIEYSNTKLEKYDTKHNLNLKVNLTKQSNTAFKCHIIHNDISTESVSEDMYMSISDAFDKIETILEKKKSKELSKRHATAEIVEDDE